MELNIKQDLLTVNQYSRAGNTIKGVKALIIHWVANPMQRAKATRDFFELRSKQTDPTIATYGGAHYIVDLDGSIIQCIPENEIGYHVGTSKLDPVSGKYYTDLAREKFPEYTIDYVYKSPNSVTLGIEMNHIDWAGKMNPETILSTFYLAKQICIKYNLNPLTDVLLHKEVVGWKDCHKWFIDNPTKWQLFKDNLVKSINTEIELTSKDFE